MQPRVGALAGVALQIGSIRLLPSCRVQKRRDLGQPPDLGCRRSEPAQRDAAGFGRTGFLQRPRFLAISEFGPRSLIYHEGRAYRVMKAKLPPEVRTGDGAELWPYMRAQLLELLAKR